MSKFNVAVVGCGKMSTAWIEYAIAHKEKIEIAALVDIAPENAKNIAEQYKLDCPVYTSLTQALKEAKPNLVFNITVPEAHFAVASEALRAGCDVFGEKPLMPTCEEAKEIIRISDETGKNYSVMQNRRYTNGIRSLRKFLETKKIGDVGFVCTDFSVAAHFGGFRDVMDNPLILDMSIHHFDAARYIMGADPVSVYCNEFNPKGSWYKGNAAAVIIYEMSDGSVFSYRGSWCSEGPHTSWEANWDIWASEGHVNLNGRDLPIYEEILPSSESQYGGMLHIHDIRKQDVEDTWKGNSAHPGCLDEMFGALEAGKRSETDCRDNIKSLMMALKAVESAQKGQKLYFDF